MGRFFFHARLPMKWVASGDDSKSLQRVLEVNCISLVLVCLILGSILLYRDHVASLAAPVHLSVWDRCTGKHISGMCSVHCTDPLWACPAPLHPGLVCRNSIYCLWSQRREPLNSKIRNRCIWVAVLPLLLCVKWIHATLLTCELWQILQTRQEICFLVLGQNNSFCFLLYYQNWTIPTQIFPAEWCSVRRDL